MTIDWFLDELRRRGVYRAAGIYAMVSWILVLMGSQILPVLLVPGWVVRLLFAMALIGLPIACGVAWLAGEGGVSEEVPAATARPALNKLEIGLLFLVLVGTIAVALRPALGPPPAPPRSIAVLPFTNLSADSDDAYFADGLHEDLLSRLARRADLKVISRNSVLVYREPGHNLREVARELGVATILEGSVRRAEGRVRVSAQLIDAQTDSHIWAETYDRELTSVFGIQSELADEIARALQSKFDAGDPVPSGRQATAEPEAYDLYLQGRSYRTRAGRLQDHWDSALTLYQAALARDPDFALVHAEISRIYSLMYWFGRDASPERVEMARAEAAAALALDPDLPEAHHAMGLVHYYGARDYDRALAEFEAARQMAPGNAEVIAVIGFVERRLGRWDRALPDLEHAISLDPRNADLVHELSTTLQYLRRYDEADAQFARALTLAPDSLDTATDRANTQILARNDGSLYTRLLDDPRAGAEPGLLAGATEWCRRSRDAGCYRKVMAQMRGDAIEAQGIIVPRPFLEAQVAALAGEERARAAGLAAARQWLMARLQDTPEDVRLHVALARAASQAGDHTAALAAAQHAVTMVPLERDALLGSQFQIELAAVAAAAGQTTLAVGLLGELIGRPAPLSRLDLREDPRWAMLREDPGFIALRTEPRGADR